MRLRCTALTRRRIRSPRGAQAPERWFPTPQVHQYYGMPVVAGTQQQPSDPTPCVITLDPVLVGTTYPMPAGTPKPDEVYHLSYSGIPDLEYELEYDATTGTGVTWDDYAATVTGGEWQPAPGFAFAGLKTLLEYWQGFAAAMILVGVLALAWPW